MYTVSRKEKVTAVEIQTLISTVNAPIFGVDTLGRVNEWNNAIARVTGFQREEIIGHPFVDILIDDGIQPRVRSILKNTLQ